MWTSISTPPSTALTANISTGRSWSATWAMTRTALFKFELIYFFRLHQDRSGLCVRSELRHRVTENRFRISDGAVFEGKPPAQAPSPPPLVAIEILSPDDRIGYVLPKLEEYTPKSSARSSAYARSR